MKHGPKIRERAFHIWAGCENDSVALKELKKEFPKVCKTLHLNTFRRWKKLDNWEQSAVKIKDELRHETEMQIVEERVKILGELRVLKDKSFAKAKSMAPKSFGEASNSYLKLSERIIELTGDRKDLKRFGDVDTLIIMIMNVLSEDERIEKVLASRGNQLIRRIHNQIEEGKN